MLQLPLLSLLALLTSRAASLGICMTKCGGACARCVQEAYPAFECSDGTCISIFRRKDGVKDCPDDSDEDVECCDDHFKCDTSGSYIGKCIHRERVGDGTSHCYDGADEPNNFQKKRCDSLEALAKNESFLDDVRYVCQTQYDESPLCIPRTWVGDEETDCPLADDEDACQHGGHGCHPSADCIPRPRGGHNCVCKDGYMGTGRECQVDLERQAQIAAREAMERQRIRVLNEQRPALDEARYGAVGGAVLQEG